MFVLDRPAGRLVHGGRAFDPRSRAWAECPPPPAAAEPLGPEGALAWLQKESGSPLRAPVGVIGPRSATAEQLAAAEAAGALLGRCGLTLICGGRQGVMEAACRGAALAGGLTIGILPDPDPALANPYVAVPIAAGIGEARNALIARASEVLIAVGDSYGTLSEVALGLRFGKRVLGLAGAARVDGVEHLPSPEALPRALAEALLGLG